MKIKCFLSLAIACCTVRSFSFAEDIATLDEYKYEDVRDVTLKHNGLFFVTGSGTSMAGVTVPFTNLPDDLKQSIITIPTNRGSCSRARTR